MTMDEVKKILEDALNSVLYDTSKDEPIAAKMNEAWNRGAKMMFSTALISFCKLEMEKMEG